MATERTPHKSRHQWENEGRIVKTNAVPGRFLVGGKAKLALYSEAQTVPIDEMKAVSRHDLGGKKPKGRVKYAYNGKTLSIHVGPRQDLRDLLRRRKFKFMRPTMSYYREATPEQVEKALQVLRKKGYTPYTEEE